MTPSPDQPSRPLPAPTARVVRAEVTESPISVTELADAVQDAAAGAVVSVAAVGLLGLSGWFITGAAEAGHFILIARTDPNEQESVVLLPELEALVP